MTWADGVQVLLQKLDPIRGLLPNKAVGYGITHFKVLRSAKGATIQDCSVGNSKMFNRWALNPVNFINVDPYLPMWR